MNVHFYSRLLISVGETGRPSRRSGEKKNGVAEISFNKEFFETSARLFQIFQWDGFGNI